MTEFCYRSPQGDRVNRYYIIHAFALWMENPNLLFVIPPHSKKGIITEDLHALQGAVVFSVETLEGVEGVDDTLSVAFSAEIAKYRTLVRRANAGKKENFTTLMRKIQPPTQYLIDGAADSATDVIQNLIAQTWIPDFDLEAEDFLADHPHGIWFPFQKFIRPNQHWAMFRRIKDLTPEISHDYYRLSSYLGKSFMPPKFRGKFTKILNDDLSYEKVDLLSDFYIENIRLTARRIEQSHSVLELFADTNFLAQVYKANIAKFTSAMSDGDEPVAKVDGPVAKADLPAAKAEQFTPLYLRDFIYHQKIQEVNIFKPTWAVKLLKTVFATNDISFFIGKKWLDISAGWGDRLLTSMALQMEYLGYDPNTNLIPGHTKMIADFGDAKNIAAGGTTDFGRPEGSGKSIVSGGTTDFGGDASTSKNGGVSVIPEPFENAKLPNEYFDVVLSSPPYFNLEIYVENQKGQSIDNYPDKDSWFNKFLFPSLVKAWKALKINGYLILHIGDSIGQKVNIAEPTNIYIRDKIPGSKFEGIIGLEGSRGVARPVWVWKKV